MARLRAVGRNVLRKEGVEKVTGAARYIDDLSFPGLLYGRTIRSTIPAGDITDITLNFDTPGFTVVDYRDMPGRNIVALIDDDQPCLAERTIRHVAEPILLLAHEDRERLLAADVQIEYRSRRRTTIPKRRPRRSRRSRSRRATSTRASPRPTRSSKASIASGHQEQLYIEPNGVIAVPGDGGRRHHRLRLDAVSVLRASRADGAARAARREGARRADRDRRRLRRQGRVSVDDRRARRAAGAQGAPAR